MALRNKPSQGQGWGPFGREKIQPTFDLAGYSAVTPAINIFLGGGCQASLGTRAG